MNKLISDTELERYIESSILKILERDFLIDEDLDLQNEGLDSLNIVSLILEFENTFNIEISDGDLSMDNFNNIKLIKLLLKKYGV